MDTLADLQAEVEAETLGATLSDAQALGDKLAETLCDTLSDAQALVDTLADK